MGFIRCWFNRVRVAFEMLLHMLQCVVQLLAQHSDQIAVAKPPPKVSCHCTYLAGHDVARYVPDRSSTNRAQPE